MSNDVENIWGHIVADKDTVSIHIVAGKDNMANHIEIGRKREHGKAIQYIQP